MDYDFYCTHPKGEKLLKIHFIGKTIYLLFIASVVWPLHMLKFPNRKIYRIRCEVITRSHNAIVVKSVRITQGLEKMSKCPEVTIG